MALKVVRETFEVGVDVGEGAAVAVSVVVTGGACPGRVTLSGNVALRELSASAAIIVCCPNCQSWPIAMATLNVPLIPTLIALLGLGNGFIWPASIERLAETLLLDANCAGADVWPME